MPLNSSLALEQPTNNSQSLLSSQEWAFVKKISDLFPDRTPSILERFQKFEAIEPTQRLKEANKALKEELRRGFVQRIDDGVTPEASKSDIENIHEHSSNMRLILRRIFVTHSSHSFIQNMGEAKKKDLLKKSFRLAAVHDMPEALTSDFTPLDMKKISPSIKNQLEDLSSRIIFESFPKKLEMLRRYEAKDRLTDERNIDHLNKVVDILEGGVDCLAMNVSDRCFNEWMGTMERGLKKYQSLSLCFGANTLTEIRKLRPMVNDLVMDFPDVQDRRKAIIDLVF